MNRQLTGRCTVPTDGSIGHHYYTITCASLAPLGDKREIGHEPTSAAAAQCGRDDTVYYETRSTPEASGWPKMVSPLHHRTRCE